MADEQVRFDVLIEAKKAIQELREMSKEATSVQDRVSKFSAFLVQKSRQWNIPVQQLLNLFRQLNAEMSKQKVSNIFGNQGGQNVFNLADQYLRSAQAAGRFQVSNDGVVKSVRNAKGQFDVAEKSVKKTGDAMERAGKKARGFGHGIDIIRTALGTLTAVAIFQFLNTLSGMFQTLIFNLREAELAVYNLINAERRLSEQGIEVTPQGLQDTIDAIKELVPILSDIQAEELVSEISTKVAPALKLTEEQIRQMAESVALLYVRNKALGVSFDEVKSQLTGAFLTGRVSQGINDLGVKLSDQIVRDEALRMGLVQTEEQFDKLTGEMEAQVKAAAMLSVVYKNATEDVQSIGEYMETADAQIEKSKSAWNDLLTVIGKDFAPLISVAFKILTHGLEIMIAVLEKVKPPLQTFVALWVAWANTTRNVPQYWKVGGIDDFVNNLKENFAAAMDSFKELSEMPDTPTAPIDALQESIEDLDAEEFGQKIEDIIEDAERAREDLEEKLGQKRADIDQEYIRKALDAQVDYGRKVEDIERDYQRDLAKIREKHREDDLKAEEDYQNKLWELRMRYLMDLEDALHARDARQVIRLQKQYEIDKEALARKQALDDKQRDDDQRNELEDAAIKRQERLEDARREYEERLADQRLAKQRELDDLNVWYRREQQDLETAKRRKLEALIDSWVDEKKVTESNAAQVYAILAKYFGPGGMTDQLYQYLATKLGTPIPMPVLAPVGSLNYGLGLSQGANAFGGSLKSPLGTKGGGTKRHFAEGGTLVATRPTTVTFGEAGAEMATFTPLSRIGRDTGKIFSSGEGGGGIGGTIVVQLDLSPDVEARVVESSMNSVAQVVTKINRTKLR